MWETIFWTSFYLDKALLLFVDTETGAKWPEPLLHCGRETSWQDSSIYFSSIMGDYGDLMRMVEPQERSILVPELQRGSCLLSHQIVGDSLWFRIKWRHLRLIVSVAYHDTAWLLFHLCLFTGPRARMGLFLPFQYLYLYQRGSVVYRFKWVVC